MTRSSAVFLAGFTLALCAASAAAPATLAEQGRIVADRRCASCHAVAKDAISSPNPKAQTFAAIAATPGMTSTALSAALQTSHKVMPNFILTPQDRRAVVAYVLSLKPPGRMKI